MAHVVEQMACNSYAREQQLRKQVNSLQIEINQSRMQHQLTAITETSYFKNVQQPTKQRRPETSQED